MNINWNNSDTDLALLISVLSALHILNQKKYQHFANLVRHCRGEEQLMPDNYARKFGLIVNGQVPEPVSTIIRSAVGADMQLLEQEEELSIDKNQGAIEWLDKKWHSHF